jgi:glycosyltransferase involved in cell wall biosynthesis
VKPPKEQKIIQIDITNACGHSCSNCTRFCGHHKKPFFMNFDTFKRAVDSMEGRFGTTGIIGGEPTLHPEFERFTEYLYSRLPVEHRSELNEFACPQRNFMLARDYAHDSFTVTHHWSGGTRNVICGSVLFSSMNRSYKKYFELIQDRFRYQSVNDHNNAMYHQPIMVTRKELGIDDKTFKRLRDNCRVQQLWGGAITPKGAFFCEIAAALDMLLDGPGGWPIEKGWWERTEKDFGGQIEWCEMCGVALETFSRDAREEIDDVSPFWMEKLKAVNSPKLKTGKVNLLKIENGVITETSKSCGKAFNLESGGEPYTTVHGDHLDKFSAQKSILYPAGFDGVMIVENHEAAWEEKYISKYGALFDSIKFISKEEHFGNALNRVLAAADPDRYIIIFTENVIPAHAALGGLKECIINPGTMHYVDFSQIGGANKNNGYFENSALLKNGFAALFNKRALSLRRLGFDRIAAARNFEEILSGWDAKKIILFTPEMEYHPKPHKPPFKPFISFVMPFYNRFDFLKKAVCSIADSNFKNIEIILIDDGSNEGGKDELLEFMNNTPNIIYIRQEENTGPGAVRNRGLKRARGEWVFFIDSDDIIYGEKLPELADFLEKKQDCDVIVLSKAKYKFPDGRLESRFYADGAFDKTDEAYNIDKIFDKVTNTFRKNSFGGTLWNFCYRRSFLEENKICFPETFASDDETFSTTALFYAKKAAVFHDYFYEYCLYTPMSINSQVEQFDCKSEKIYKGRSAYFNRLLELRESNLPADNARHIENFIYENILCTLYEPECYKGNAVVERCFDGFHDAVRRFSKNWTRKLYIAPCFMGAVNAAALLKNWGASAAGFVDKSPDSPRAAACKKETGLGVYTINELLNGGTDGGILIFSKHQDAIESLFNSLGLVSGFDYLKTGLL